MTGCSWRLIHLGRGDREQALPWALGVHFGYMGSGEPDLKRLMQQSGRTGDVGAAQGPEQLRAVLDTRLDTCRRRYGPAASYTLYLQGWLADQLATLGRYDEALALLQELRRLDRDRGESGAVSLLGLLTLRKGDMDSYTRPVGGDAAPVWARLHPAAKNAVEQRQHGIPVWRKRSFGCAPPYPVRWMTSSGRSNRRTVPRQPMARKSAFNGAAGQPELLGRDQCQAAVEVLTRAVARPKEPRNPYRAQACRWRWAPTVSAMPRRPASCPRRGRPRPGRDPGQAQPGLALARRMLAQMRTPRGRTLLGVPPPPGLELKD